MIKNLTLEQAHKTGRMFRKAGTSEWKLLKDIGQITGEEALAKIWEAKDKETYTRHEVEVLIRKTIRELNHKTNCLDSLHKTELVLKIMEE